MDTAIRRQQPRISTKGHRGEAGSNLPIRIACQSKRKKVTEVILYRDINYIPERRKGC